MQNRCEVKDCLFKVKEKNLCKRHLDRLSKYGNLNVVGNPKSKQDNLSPCQNDKCQNLIWYKGFCNKCLRRIKYRGDCNIVNPTPRKYNWNEKIFDNINNDIAWVLGWLATDGSVNEKHYSIKIGITDREILEKISKIVGYDGPIKKIDINKYKNTASYGKKTIHMLCINSIVATKKLSELGIHQNKTFNLELPKNISDENFYQFLRGVIEGDGSIVYTTPKTRKFGQLVISINSASLKFLEQIKNRIPFNCFIFKPNKDKKVYRLSFYSSNAVSLGEKIYKDCEDNFLKRKREKFLTYIKEREAYLANK